MIGHFTKKRNKQHTQDNLHTTPLSSSLEKNIDSLKAIFEQCDDVVFQQAKIENHPCCFIYISNMISPQAMLEFEQALPVFIGTDREKEEPISVLNGHFSYSGLSEVNDIQSVTKQILSGNSVLLLHHKDLGFVFRTSNLNQPASAELSREQTVRGPKEAFSDNLDANIMQIRKRIRTASLKVKTLTIGEQTKTDISILYMKGIADTEIVKEVQRRLSKIKVDGILDSHYIESMIQDAPHSPVPTVFSTERPDRICGSLLDGKVSIFVNGSPIVLTVPAVFVEFLHSSEDYYDGSLVATMIRWIRFLGLFVTLILPAFFVALTTFHQDLLQNPFIIRIAANREALPYPVLIESLFMLLTYELLREAGLRMPKPFGGPIVTILGLVLISQAAIQAGIIGPILAVVISVTALTSFILPNYAFHQIIRFAGIPLLILGGLFGFMGIIVGLMFGLTYLVSLRSFGVPYFSPVSPARKESWKDVFFRAPWWAMETRPAGYGIDNVQRSNGNKFAKPPQEGGESGE